MLIRVSWLPNLPTPFPRWRMTAHTQSVSRINSSGGILSFIASLTEIIKCFPVSSAYSHNDLLRSITQSPFPMILNQLMNCRPHQLIHHMSHIPTHSPIIINHAYLSCSHSLPKISLNNSAIQCELSRQLSATDNSKTCSDWHSGFDKVCCVCWLPAPPEFYPEFASLT